MGEGNKQVRVDNWGIFFLQRLQVFFNNTDYCDLTLQFEGNVQLKVHRLVMNACTEYFQILEQTCEMNDDILIMPPDLQADVVLPIVNFMYTGMLEFHMSMYDKLYKTANLMNITVLTKLLDAQKAPITPITKTFHKRATHPAWNLHGKKNSNKLSDSDLPAPLPGRKIPVWKRRNVPAAAPHTVVSQFFPEKRSDLFAGIDNTPKPTRFEWPEEELSNLNFFDSNFDQISYSSKPLLTQGDEPRPSTSFDSIKDADGESIQKSSNYDDTIIDMEAVKDYVKEQRIRSNLTEEDADDMVENDFENDMNTDSSQDSQKRKHKYENASSKRVRFSVNEKENQVKNTKINIKPTGKASTGDVDHTKIISEVLKKYPNLVKKNKNIRLKILAKSNTTSVTVEEPKKMPLKKAKPRPQLQNVVPYRRSAKSVIPDNKSEEDGPWTCQKCSTPLEPAIFVLYYLYLKHMTDVHNEKFDSRMCRYCGHKSSRHSMLMYHQYTKHDLKPPLAYNFPKCSSCPYIALSERLLVKHKMKHTKNEVPCIECKITFTNQQALTSHMQITGHTGKSTKCSYDCQYCIKKFQSGTSLFSHMRMQHRDEARRDGIVSIDETIEEEEELDEEEMDTDEQDESEAASPDATSEKKIKILSDVKLSSMDMQRGNVDAQQNVTLEPSSEAEALNNVASGIATSLGLVDVVVLDDNQQYILQTDNQENMDNEETEFILPDLQDTQTFTTTQQVVTTEQNVLSQSMLHSSDIGSTDELVMVLTDHDYGDGNNEVNNENSNIVVLYSHPVEGQNNQFITSQGNLMLTSQSGLIELRNTNNTVVSSNTTKFITSSTDRSENSQIESIEMIQREINQHPDSKIQAENTENSNKDSEGSKNDKENTEVSNDTEKTKSEKEGHEEQCNSVDGTTTDKKKLKSSDNTDENVEMENTQDVSKVSDTNTCNVSAENEEEIQNESADGDNTKKQAETEENISEATNNEEDSNSLEENDKNTIKDTTVPERITTESDQNIETELNSHSETQQNVSTKESSPIVENVSEAVQDQEEPVCENGTAELEKSKDTEEHEETLENKTEADSSNIGTEEESTSMADETLQNENSQPQDENDENSQTSQNSCVDKEEDQGNPSKPKQSAKHILDDWEDTDSQQSDTKNGSSVNKLIDDWDEDDDDNRKS